MLTEAGVSFEAVAANVDEDAVKASLIHLAPRDLADMRAGDRRLRRLLPDRRSRGAIVREDRGKPVHRAGSAFAASAKFCSVESGDGTSPHSQHSGAGSGMTRRYAEVIGDPIEHSKSPIIHQFWLDALGIDAHYRATRVAAASLANYFASRRDQRRDRARRSCAGW